MNELSLYILDLTQNAISAGAALVEISIRIDRAQDLLIIEIIDDGSGMDEAFVRQVLSPFTTTRTTRKVGLGLPMLDQQARQCDGRLDIDSKLGVGTHLTASFRLSHVDLPPMGDLSATMRALIVGSPEKPDFVLRYWEGGVHFVLDTREIKRTLDGVPLTVPAVLQWIGEYVAEGIRESSLDNQSESFGGAIS